MTSRILFTASLFVSAAVLAAQATQTTPERNPLADSPAARAAGARLFQQTCASCHGDIARAPSLATSAFARGGQDREIFQNIRNGIPGTQMPAFTRLSSDEIWQLVTYVRSLTNPAADA